MSFSDLIPMSLVPSHVIFSSFLCEGWGEGGRLRFAIMWKGEEKGGKLFWSNLHNQFLDYRSLAAKIHQENCFSHERVILLFTYQIKINRGRGGKGNKHVLSQALSWVFSTA